MNRIFLFLILCFQLVSLSVQFGGGPKDGATTIPTPAPTPAAAPPTSQPSRQPTAQPTLYPFTKICDVLQEGDLTNVVGDCKIFTRAATPTLTTWIGDRSLAGAGTNYESLSFIPGATEKYNSVSSNHIEVYVDDVTQLISDKLYITFDANITDCQTNAPPNDGTLFLLGNVRISCETIPSYIDSLWHQYEIEIQGNHTTINIDGILVNEYDFTSETDLYTYWTKGITGTYNQSPLGVMMFGGSYDSSQNKVWGRVDSNVKTSS